MKINKITIEVDSSISVIEFFKKVDELREDNEINYSYINNQLILTICPKKLKDVCKDCKVNHFDNKDQYLNWLKNNSKVKSDKGYKWIKRK